MELIELQYSNELKSKFRWKYASLLDFYKKYLESKQHTNLVKHAKKMASIIGSTYAREQLFLTIKLTKTKLRAQLYDEHLRNIMLLSSSKLSRKLQKLSKKNNIKYHINLFLPALTCCILFGRYELLKPTVTLIKIL